MKNIYTDNTVPGLFRELTYGETLTLNSYDPPYYALRIEELGKNPFDRQGFTDPFKDLQVSGFQKVENPNADKQIHRELIFLKMLDLVATKGKINYVHKNAAVFYGPNGIFRGGNKNNLKQLFRTFFLPGRFWRNYYSRLYLPDTLKLTSRLEKEMIEIEEEYLIMEEEEEHRAQTIHAQ